MCYLTAIMTNFLKPKLQLLQSYHLYFVQNKLFPQYIYSPRASNYITGHFQPSQVQKRKVVPIIHIHQLGRQTSMIRKLMAIVTETQKTSPDIAKIMLKVKTPCIRLGEQKTQ